MWCKLSSVAANFSTMSDMGKVPHNYDENLLSPTCTLPVHAPRTNDHALIFGPRVDFWAQKSTRDLSQGF